MSSSSKQKQKQKQKQQGSCREASHAGSWYTDRGDELSAQLERWMSEAKADEAEVEDGVVRAIISPHAGYSYSGPTAAYAFKHLRARHARRGIKRVFVLGPSHHFWTKQCLVPAVGVDTYETPAGDLKLDTELLESLCKQWSALFGRMSLDVDEEEHSIEMQLPYIAQILHTTEPPSSSSSASSASSTTAAKTTEKATTRQETLLVPILVGSLDSATTAAVGRALRPHLADEDNFFVISSDFCHWGKRFQYTFYDKSQGEVWQSIEALDRLGMQVIESGNAKRFAKYLKTYKNTICGRNPIAVLLHAMQGLEPELRARFVRYAQSSKCKKLSDSSVSYAAAAVC